MTTAKPLFLPITFGLNDGSNANLLMDAKGVVIGQLFGIRQGVSVAEARNTPLYAKGLRAAEFIVHATNVHDGLVLALKQISATAQHKRIADIATAALQAAREI